MVGGVAVVVEEVLVIWQASLLAAFSQMGNQTISNSSISRVINLADMEGPQVEDREEA